MLTQYGLRGRVGPAHNHPPGDPAPSRHDLTLTRRLFLAGELVNVPLRDHLIYTDRGAVSIHAQHPALFMLSHKQATTADRWDGYTT